MGIYIKGMEMPKSCYGCDFCVNGVDVENIVVICTALQKEIFALVGERRDDCPLVEVPSADVDELQKPKWIPVTERLPEQNTRVIGFMAWKGITAIEYQHGKWYSIEKEENATAGDFFKKVSSDRLPTLTMTDFMDFEKSAELPWELSTTATGISSTTPYP